MHYGSYEINNEFGFIIWFVDVIYRERRLELGAYSRPNVNFFFTLVAKFEVSLYSSPSNYWLMEGLYSRYCVTIDFLSSVDNLKLFYGIDRAYTCAYRPTFNFGISY